jgi:hypothetical protein
MDTVEVVIGEAHRLIEKNEVKGKLVVLVDCFLCMVTYSSDPTC